MKTKISVVSPIYGCTDCLERLCAKVRAAFEHTEIEWELILVDDRDPDNPWPKILEIAKEDKRIRGIRLSKNHGQHLAIWAGLAQARGDWVAVVDCDLQDDPAIIPLLHKLASSKGVDAMIVSRGNWADSFFRRMASRLFYRTVELLGGIGIRNAGNFGLYSRRMVDNLLLFGEQEVFLPMMVALTGLKTETHELTRSERLSGKSSYSLLRLVRMASSVLVRFSDRPLKLSVLVGFGFSFVAAMISILLVALWLMGKFTVPGWTSTVLSVWFLSGLVLATLGLHGFYIGRIFAEVKGRPRIIIEETTDA